MALDLTITPKLRLLHLFLMIALVALCIAIGEYNQWLDREYVRNNPHATATIIAVWSEPSRHGDRIYGRITFTHHMDAKVVVCEIEAYLGTPQDNLVVGSTIDIVPRKDHCQAPMFTKRILSTDGQWRRLFFLDYLTAHDTLSIRR